MRRARALPLGSSLRTGRMGRTGATDGRAGVHRPRPSAARTWSRQSCQSSPAKLWQVKPSGAFGSSGRSGCGRADRGPGRAEDGVRRRGLAAKRAAASSRSLGGAGPAAACRPPSVRGRRRATTHAARCETGRGKSEPAIGEARDDAADVVRGAARAPGEASRGDISGRCEPAVGERPGYGQRIPAAVGFPCDGARFLCSGPEPGRFREPRPRRRARNRVAAGVNREPAASRSAAEGTVSIAWFPAVAGRNSHSCGAARRPRRRAWRRPHGVVLRLRLLQSAAHKEPSLSAACHAHRFTGRVSAGREPPRRAAPGRHPFLTPQASSGTTFAGRSAVRLSR